MPYSDPERQKAAQRAHYEANKDKFLQRQWTKRNRVSRQLVLTKQGKACEHCGEDHPACLDFHHVDPKLKTVHIYQMRREGWSEERVAAELAKCIILCSNCHRKLHWDAQTHNSRPVSIDGLMRHPVKVEITDSTSVQVAHGDDPTPRPAMTDAGSADGIEADR